MQICCMVYFFGMNAAKRGILSLGGKCDAKTEKSSGSAAAAVGAVVLCGCCISGVADAEAGTLAGRRRTGQLHLYRRNSCRHDLRPERCAAGQYQVGLHRSRQPYAGGGGGSAAPCTGRGSVLRKAGTGEALYLHGGHSGHCLSGRDCAGDSPAVHHAPAGTACHWLYAGGERRCRTGIRL